MPAADEEMAITKLVTVHTGNSRPDIGLPTVQAEVPVILDGEVVTRRRTAALSLLAAQTLAPNPSGPLLVVGAGTQARYHVEALLMGWAAPIVSPASCCYHEANSFVTFYN